jgi:large subunit ribosomal protein L9
MKVILVKDHPRLGLGGAVLEVADGYARNYLLPQGWAHPATAQHIRHFQQQQEKQKQLEAKRLEVSRRLAEKLKGVSITIAAAAGEEDRLYGSVTAADVAEALKREGFEIDKKQVKLEEPIKRLGIYTLEVQLGPEARVDVKVWIVKE